MTEIPHDMTHDRWDALRSIAALTDGYYEMALAETGTADDAAIETAIRRDMASAGLTTRTDALITAEIIRRHPQPPDVPADERERRRPIEDMVGVTPSEVQLAATLRARELMLRIADTLP